MEPGTTSIRTPVATDRPRSTSAVVRRSSIRLFVHEPTKTVSMAMSRMGTPGVRPMYSSARSAASRGAPESQPAGSGTRPDSGTPWAGLVPQVTNGVT